jgi:nucleotide-binding universal stress UspA family protein
MMTTEATQVPVVRRAPRTGNQLSSHPARIMVPVDGSPFAERALPVASWLARAIAAPVHLLQVVPTSEDAIRAIHYLGDLARRHTAAGWDVVRGDDPAAAILNASEPSNSGLACLATHGRDRRAALLGSVAAAVFDRTAQPVVLVGPNARPPCAGDAPVVVTVDGSPEDAAVVEVAADWAARLDRPLIVAAVIEPDRPLPAEATSDPAAHAAQLATGVARAGCAVSSLVVDDVANVRHGLLRLLDRTTALLVAGARRRTLRPPALVGGRPSRILHEIEVPALLVPLGTSDDP